MRQRSTTPGNVRQVGTTADGRDKWRVQVYLGKNAAGAPRYTSKTVIGTRTEAELVRAELVAEHHPRGNVTVSESTVGDVLDMYLKLNSSTWSASSRRDFDTHKNRLEPILGIKARKLTGLDVEKLYADLHTSLKPSSVRRTHAVLNAALNWGEKRDLLDKNPVRGLSIKVPARTIQPPSPEDMQKFMTYVDEHEPHYSLFYRMAAATGARRGELLGIQWADLDGNKLHIKRVLVNGPEGPVVREGTKTGKGRVVTLDPTTVKLLEAHKPSDSNLEPWLFGGRKPWVPNRVSDATRRIERQSGITVGHLHNFRHFHITQLLANGVPVRQVADRVGHTDAHMTLNVYSHAIASLDEQSADTISSVLDMSN